MENLKNIIESKKLKSSDKKPRYATRKLSVGLVSCMLGYFVFMSPTVVNAQAVEGASEPTSIETVADISGGDAESQSKETKETKAVEAPVAEVAETETPAEGVAEEKSELVEKAKTKEEAAAEVAETETPAAAEEIDAKKEAADVVEEKPAEEVTEAGAPLTEEGKEALGISEEIDPEAQTAEASKDISNNIINPRVSIRTQNTETPGTLNAANGEQLKWGLSFTTPEGTKEGDTFTIHLSDNMSLKGIEPDTDYALPIEVDGKKIATGKRIDRQTIQYTFTKEINGLKYARVYIINSAQENRDKVRESSDQTFKINVGEKAFDEQTIKVDFGKIYGEDSENTLNGKSQYTKFNPEDGSFTQVFYLNPESKEITISTTNDENGREYGKVGFLLSSPHNADSPRSIDFKGDGNTKIEVKKLPKGAKLPDAVIENPEGAQTATNVKGEFRDFKGEPMFIMNFGNGNKIDSPYVVVVKGHANKINGDYPILYSNGTLYGDGTASLFLDNLYSVQYNNADAEGEEGEKETLGYFKEHHIYITKEDGTEKSRFEIPGATVSGTADQYYYTDKNIIPGYHFVKVDTDSLKKNPAYKENGEEAKGNFEVGETKEVTYIYERDIKHGSFQEHHIYQSLDEDGNIVAEETVTKDRTETTGFDETKYTTSKKDKEGNVVTDEKDSDDYKLVNVKATNDASKDLGVKFDEKGAVTTGNYVNDKKLEVTYTYQKNVVTKGNFIEHHIYQTVDEDDKVISTDDTVNKKATTGKETEKYTTAKEDRDGYKLTKVEGKEKASFNEDGSKAEDNYVKGKTQEVTYIYQKTKESTKPVKPNDPNKDPKKPNEPTPLVPLTPAEPVEPNESTPPTRDHKTPGTPVVTEVPPTKVVEIEKTHEEKPEESKEVENKEEKVEVKEIEKEEAPELVSKEFVKDKGLEAQKKSYKAKDDDKAPKTSDAGILSSLGLGSLAASGLAFLELRKRNKKNK